MRNIALKLMYNGTAYHGWQMQRTEASVQETLQRGLSMVCGERVRLTGVGRTDAGVHAERYVANFRTSSRIPIDRLPFAVNTHTPEDIVVREALEVADDFNAIGSCLKKEYTYRIYNSRIKNPFYVNRAYFYPKKLDEAVMDAAARACLSAACRARHIPFNSACRVDGGSAIFPAVHRQGRTVLAVSSLGASPVASARLRDALAAHIPAEMDAILDAMAALRGVSRAAFPRQTTRRAFLRRSLDQMLSLGRALTEAETDAIIREIQNTEEKEE